MLLPWKLYDKEGHGLREGNNFFIQCFLMFRCFPLPLTDTFSRLEEASVVTFLEGLVSLSDEGGGPLNALLTTGYLLCKLPQPHCLDTNMTRREMNVLIKNKYIYGYFFEI